MSVFLIKFKCYKCLEYRRILNIYNYFYQILSFHAKTRRLSTITSIFEVVHLNCIITVDYIYL